MTELGTSQEDGEICAYCEHMTSSPETLCCFYWNNLRAVFVRKTAFFGFSDNTEEKILSKRPSAPLMVAFEQEDGPSSQLYHKKLTATTLL